MPAAPDSFALVAPAIDPDMAPDLVTADYLTMRRGDVVKIITRSAEEIHLSPDDARLLACSLRRLARESEEATLDETYVLAPAAP